MIKKLILNSFKKLGIKLEKITDLNDLHLYKTLFNENSIKNRSFYNIGAGSFSHPAWTNIDYYSDWYKKNSDKIHIHHDLMSLTPLPIDTNSAEVIYSSHTIEHISDKAAQLFFNSAYKALKTKGCIRITAPDADLHLHALLNNDLSFYYMKDNYSSPQKMRQIHINKPMNKATIGELFLWYIAASVSPIHADSKATNLTDSKLKKLFKELSPEKALNHITALCCQDTQKKYPGNHINWWNPDKVKKMLKKAGFKNIIHSGYGQSFCPVLRNTNHFDSTHPKWSFYIEAFK